MVIVIPSGLVRVLRVVPRRIRVHQRTVVAIRIQIEAQRITLLPRVRVLLHKSRGDRIIHSRVQVIEPGLLVILIPSEKDRVVDISGLFQCVPERMVIVRSGKFVDRLPQEDPLHIPLENRRVAASVAAGREKIN